MSRIAKGDLKPVVPAREGCVEVGGGVGVGLEAGRGGVEGCVDLWSLEQAREQLFYTHQRISLRSLASEFNSQVTSNKNKNLESDIVGGKEEREGRG